MAQHHMHPLIIAHCSATLHLPRQPFRRLVILVNSFGLEGTYTVRAWAALGEDLAHAGVGFLRYDLPDQGDSLDLAREADAASAWLRSVHDMVAWAREQFPGVDICLCGYRLGALIAAMAAPAIKGLDALVLFAPVLSGRNFLRELVLNQGEVGGSGAASEAQELAQEGWKPSDASLATISTWALKQIDTRAAAPILVLADSGLRQLGSWLGIPEGASAQGRHQLSEANDLLLLRADAHSVRVPESSFATAVQWLRGGQSSAAAPMAVGAAQAAVAHAARYVLELPGARERSIRFGPHGRYAGTWCVADRPASGVPPLLILNTGGNPRSGRNRLSVWLARRLAQAGVASLRIDNGGTGDTVPVMRDANRMLYGDDCIVDVACAIETMEHDGFRKPILLGMCSGAYLGLQSALAQHRIGGLAMINAYTFLPWFDIGSTQDSAPQNPVIIKQLDRYHRIIFTANFWHRLLKGELRVRAVSAKVLEAWWQRIGGAIQQYLPSWAALLPRVATVHQRFQDLHQRQLPLLLVYDDTDPGLNELQACFGHHGARLARQKNVELHFVQGADHTFTSLRSAAILQQLLLDFVNKIAA